MCTIDEGGALCDKDFWAFVFVLCHKHLAGLSRLIMLKARAKGCRLESRKGFLKFYIYSKNSRFLLLFKLCVVRNVYFF